MIVDEAALAHFRARAVYLEGVIIRARAEIDILIAREWREDRLVGFSLCTSDLRAIDRVLGEGIETGDRFAHLRAGRSADAETKEG